MNKQVSLQKVLRIMKMKDALVNVTPSIHQRLIGNEVIALAYLKITVLHKGFLYTTETNVNSEQYYIRSLLRDNIHVSRNGLRSLTLDELLLKSNTYIAENTLKLTISHDLSWS